MRSRLASSPIAEKYLPGKDFNSCDEKHAQVLKTVFRS